MRENLTSGSMWQGMETRHGDGIEALSQETESNGSTAPKSKRHPLTLPGRVGNCPPYRGPNLLNSFVLMFSSSSTFCPFLERDIITLAKWDTLTLVKGDSTTLG